MHRKSGKNTVFLLILLIPLILSGCSGPSFKRYLTDALKVTIDKGSREVSYTNKQYGQYYMQSSASFDNGWMGWTLREKRIFNDYSISVNGKDLDRTQSLVSVYPDKLVRFYPGSDVDEQFLFPDDEDAVVISLKNLKKQKVVFSILGLSFPAKATVSENLIIINADAFEKEQNFSIAASGEITEINFSESTSTFTFEGLDNANIVFAMSKKPNAADELLRKTEELFLLKQERIEKLLQAAYIQTEDTDFRNAYLWAVASLDALVTKQQMKGIFAGLPWFNNYWGRDTFISLPGATYTNGNFDDAREVLLSFAKYQDKRQGSKTFGRIPNRITLQDVIYNTADGTPRFIHESYEYLKYSGDLAFLDEIYPAVKRAFYGATMNYVDRYGFLTHADADTWMDAVGPEAPWSPRGNRANDIQALWYQQLTASREMALLKKDKAFAARCDKMIEKLTKSFNEKFILADSTIIADHLNRDGSPDTTLRPNLFFPLNADGLVTDIQTRFAVLTKGMQNIVYPYGVLSLDPRDTNFHPFHQYPPYYVKDAAYHNGIIWTWNAGPVIQSLCNVQLQDLAWNLSKDLTRQILTQGAVGTIAELTDALPRSGGTYPELSGTFSQAWSLAEYIRAIYQDYFGSHPNALEKTLYLMPALPSSLRNITFKQRIGNDYVKVTYRFDRARYRVEIDAMQIQDTLTIAASLINLSNANYLMKSWVTQDDKLVFEIPADATELSALQTERNGEKITVSSDIYVDPPENKQLYDQIRFAEPRFDSTWKSISTIGYEVMHHAAIKKGRKDATVILRSTDPENDTKYQYPTNPNFKPGILDITAFEVAGDDSMYYFNLSFKNLSNPMWHPEFGFQLTLAGIYINTPGAPSGVDAGFNALYRFEAARAFSRMILVGGGIEVYDHTLGKIAAYIPQSVDVANPLGDVNKKSISFAIPKRLLGEISRESVITILVGGQNDGGGAGIGEFRSVTAKPSEWTGGGRKSASESNVYDVLKIN